MARPPYGEAALKQGGPEKFKGPGASASGPFFVFSRVHHPLRTLRLESQGGKGLNPAGIPYPGLSLLCALKKHHRRGFFSAEPEETKLRALSQECLKGCAGVHAGADKSFRPVRHGRGEEVRPAGEGAAHEQPVVVKAVFFIHARARCKFQTAGGQGAFGPFTAGVVEFVSAPHASQRMEGVLCRHARRHSLVQVRECSASILKFAKETNTPVILIGHINKEGSIAGPKVLEHIVDTVLQFEGDQHYMYRILRSIKNRFGSTAELGIYEMRQNGLRQVSNPSELLLSQDHDGMSGVAIASAIEGVRPFLIETQALVSSAVYGNPQRSATGFDLRRMNMLLAVLEKRVGFKLAQKDVFLNIAGGLKVNDPAIDLSVISAILSSNMDTEVERDTCMAGEVGLSGEIRPVNRIEQRIGEAEKLGFKRILIPKHNLQGMDTSKLKIEIIPVRKVEEAFRALFG